MRTKYRSRTNTITFVILILIAIIILNQSPLIRAMDADDTSGGGGSIKSAEKAKELPRELFDFLNSDSSDVTSPSTNPSPAQDTGSPQATIYPNPTLPPTPQQEGCPISSQRIQFEGTRYRHLNQRLYCDPPRMIVIHWSASWSSADATFDVLNSRERSCHFAVDKNGMIQMLDFYPNAVEHSWCVGGDANRGSISFEITGAWFDEVLLNSPNSQQYKDLMIMTDKTVDMTCKILNRYHIPKTEIYGHYQWNSEKSDPGVKYLQFFKQEVNKKC